jgi:hypothetical protein
MNCSRGILRCIVVLAALAGLQAEARAVDEFHAYLRPQLADTLAPSDTFSVARGDSIDISFLVDSSARQFNAYEVSLGFDPTLIQFANVFEGPLFTGACGNRFTHLGRTDSTVTYAHVILCSGVSLNGPGVMSIFRFRAREIGTTPVNIISDPDRTFFDAGLYIWPQHPTYPRQVIFHNIVVRVLDPTSGLDPRPRVDPAGPRLEFAPNPVAREGSFRLYLPGPGPATLQVFDPAGRMVWACEPERSAGGWSNLSWGPGTARPFPSGSYFCLLSTGRKTATCKVLVIR